MAILTGPLEGEALTAIEGVELDRLVELLWRPDGSGFTFHADNPKRWVDLDLDGSAREWGGLDNVPILKTGAAYSPSGRWICANDRHDLWLIAAGGGRITRLKDWDDQDSWKQFFDTYSELILNVARKAGLRDAEAHEVVQETVISVSKSIGQFKTGSEHGSFKSWLLNTTRWRIMDQFRKRRKLEGYVQSIPGTVGDEREGRTRTMERLPGPDRSGIETSWDEEWAKHRLQVALRRLRPKVRAKSFQIFQLLVAKQLSPDEVTKLLGVSRAAVYVTKHRLSKLFREELRRVDREEG